MAELSMALVQMKGLKSRIDEIFNATTYDEHADLRGLYADHKDGDQMFQLTITLFSGLPRHRKQSRRTIPGRAGFYIAEAAASPKKPTSRRAKPFSGVTATQKNVTARENAGKRWKPATGNTSTGRKWNG